MKLTRREFTVSAAAASAALATGCLHDDGQRGTPREESRFSGENFPAIADATRWFHESADYDVYLEPSKEVVELPHDEVEFTIYNNGDEEFGLNPYRWNAYKLHGDEWSDGEWKHLNPRATPEPWEMVPPGDSFSRTVTVDNDGEGDFYANPGVFAVELGTYSHEEGSGTYAAAFEAEGPEFELSPSDAVVDVEHSEEGSVVVVTTRYYEDIEDHQTPAEIVVRREGVSAPVELIREQVMYEEPLRNTLSYFDDGVDEVRLKVPTTHRGNLGMLLGGGVTGGAERRFTYEDDVYTVSMEETE